MASLNYIKGLLIFLKAEKLWGSAWVGWGLLEQKMGNSRSLLDLQQQEVADATWEGSKARWAPALQRRHQIPYWLSDTVFHSQLPKPFLAQILDLDHRILEWMRLERTFGSHLVQSTTTHSWLPKTMSRWLPGMKIPQPLWETGVSAWSTSQWKSVSWYSEGILSFHMYPLPPVLSPGTPEKSLSPLFLQHSFRYLLECIDAIPLNLLFSGLNPTPLLI